MRPVLILFVLILSGATAVHAHPQGLNHLYQLRDAKTRSISPENLTGAKGQGGKTPLAEGTAHRAARDLGTGWKVNPYIHIAPGTTFTLGEISESGIINHIWLTPVGNYRDLILRFYWDNEAEASVEVPVGDFFASGWGMGNEPRISSLAVCVNPRSGFNSYWHMPFRKGAKVTMENRSDEQATIYYQIDYSLEAVAEDTPYFHAQFRRTNPLPYKEDFTIVDGIRGRGIYVGTYLAHGANSPGWWGEGEIKFFLDGDDDYPTICGTGEEDYFCGSYGYGEHVVDGKDAYEDFTTPYGGFYHVDDYEGSQRRFGQYRWHITDPIRFERDLRITIQSLGWQSEGRYLPLEDDLASVAYWYQLEPHAPFPPLPDREQLQIVDQYPLTGMLEESVFVDTAEVTLSGHASATTIFYTRDGSPPTPEAIRYEGPFIVSENVTIKAQAFHGEAPVSPVLVGTFTKQEPLSPSPITPSRSGVHRDFIALDRPLERTAELDKYPTTRSENADSFQLADPDLPERFGMIYRGYVQIPATGVYTFYVASNDGSTLTIANKVVVNNDGPHGEREVAGQIALVAGSQPFELRYFQAGAAKALRVSIEGPTLKKQDVSPLLAH